MKNLFLIFPLLFCLSSCWDYSEPSAQNYVLGLGIDYGEDNFILSVETVKITNEPTSLSASESVIIEGTGSTILNAIQDAEAKAGKKLYWGHTELIILGDTVVKNHLNEVCDFISRSADIYSNVNLSVAKDAAANKIFSASTPQNGLVSAHIANIFENEENTHRFIGCELWQLKRNFPNTLIPVIRLDEYPIADGSAIIQNGAFTGYLSGDATQTFALVEQCASGSVLPAVVIDNTTVSTKILDVKKENEKLAITISILNSSSPFDTVNPENRKVLEGKVAELISVQINSIFSNIYEVSVTLENSGLIKR